MYEIAGAVAGWRRAGRRFVVARVTEWRGFGQRSPLDAIGITEGGERAGTLLHGLADDDIAAASAALLTGSQQEPARLITVDASDSRAAENGLICGGSATVLLQREICLPEPLWSELGEARPGVLVTMVGGPDLGSSLYVSAAGQASGSLGHAEVDSAAAAEAARLVRTGRFVTQSWSIDGRLMHAIVLFPVTELVVVGEGQLVDALTHFAAGLDWNVSVLAGGEPDRSAIAGLPPSAAVVVLTHDLDLAAPALAAALESKAGYVGAVGSRRTQAARAERLEGMGISGQERARLHGPAGLDLGARSPAEIALSICAEILAESNGRSREPLSRLTGPVHQPTAPGPPG